MDAAGQRATRFGFGTNGFTNHRLDDALTVLAALGYDGVALTLDHGHLDPYASDFRHQVGRAAGLLGRLGLSVVVETGARYILDPFRKHFPALVSDGAERRIEYLLRAVEAAAELGAEALSFWSGVLPDGTRPEIGWDRLVRGVGRILDAAAAHGVTLGLEPEPGMLIDTIDRYDELCVRLGHPEHLGLTLDIGHCMCLEPATIPDCIRRAGRGLVNVQIDDMRRGVHEHLEFGDGEIDFPPVLTALTECGYSGLVSVELPRHAHAAPQVARQSLDYLRRAAAVPAETAAVSPALPVLITARGDAASPEMAS
ncbi:MAG TPA: sugar phosphate isomerase/epimerase family protein [Streptosporangiaceae bacterium]